MGSVIVTPGNTALGKRVAQESWLIFQGSPPLSSGKFPLDVQEIKKRYQEAYIDGLRASDLTQTGKGSMQEVENGQVTQKKYRVCRDQVRTAKAHFELHLVYGWEANKRCFLRSFNSKTKTRENVVLLLTGAGHLVRNYRIGLGTQCLLCLSL